MSAYKIFNNIQFTNGELLVAALQQMGYQVEVGKELDISRYGHPQTAQIRVSRDQLKSCADLGFSWDGKAFVPLINDMDAYTGRPLDEDWRQCLQRMYSRVAVLRFLKEKGAMVQSSAVGEDGTTIIRARVEV